MIIIDIPTWMLMIGWVFTQLLKIVATMFLLVFCLNKVDQWVAKRGKDETNYDSQRNYRSRESQG